MLRWLKGWHKDLTVHEHLQALQNTTKSGQQLPIFSTLNALASEDEKACSQLCASELIEVLKGLENSEALAAGCKVLDTVASKTDDYGRDSLGNFGAVKFVTARLKDKTFSNLWPLLCTILSTLCTSEKNKAIAKALGIVEILLKTFQKQRLCPADMDFIVGGLKTVMNLQEDPIDDLRAGIPQMLYIMSTCVHRPSGSPTRSEEEHANLACELGCFMARSAALANAMFDRGVLYILVDMVPVEIQDQGPPYLANALRFLIAISKVRDLGFESLPPMMAEKLISVLRQALEKCNKPRGDGKVGKLVGTMLNAWLASQAICEVCDSNDRFLETLVNGEGLRLLFDLLKSSFSPHLIRYGAVSREEMFELKEGLLLVLEELCKNTKFHARVNACGGVGAFKAVMKSNVQDKLKEHAQKAIWSLERKSPSKSPTSFTSDNPLFENRLSAAIDDGPTSLSHLDTQDHVSAPHSCSQVKVTAGYKRKAPMSQSNFETADTSDGGGKKFRQGPIFAAPGENMG